MQVVDDSNNNNSDDIDDSVTSKPKSKIPISMQQRTKECKESIFTHDIGDARARFSENRLSELQFLNGAKTAKMLDFECTIQTGFL